MDLSIPFSSQPKHRVAVLVDGDNFPHSGLKDLEKVAVKLGDITIRRVFGDMAIHKAWSTETTYTAMHCTTAAGKNRADMALVVAAMDFAHRGMASAFLIVSDDRDFAPLVSHLCEHGYRVDWIGKPKAKVVPEPQKALDLTVVTALDKRLKQVITSQPEAKEGITLGQVGQLMKGEAVKAQTGKATWRAYLKGKPSLYSVAGKGAASRVRVTF